MTQQPAREIAVLVVCTGNICRSPTGEGVLRRLVEQRGLADRVRVASAGTHDYHVGEGPDPRSVKHARRRGYDLSALRASQVSEADFHAHDYILAMDRGHLRALQRMASDRHRGKIRLFVPDRDVPDPYYGGPEGFEEVLDLVEAACRDLLLELRGS